ncbi:Vacuolar protein sorting-associated protein 53 [Naganishia albida]|nr:Vacuolar protein sorting-associated protein 53 [Naganishia albida]
MESQQLPAPPLSASRRAQIHQILTEYGNKQVTSSSAQDVSAASERIPGGTASVTIGGIDSVQDVRSDVQDTMEKLRQLIPDRESLPLIPQKQSALHEEIAAIKTEIAALKQELLRDQDPERMQLVQSLIGQLIHQINIIREKASEAEAIVKHITSDIQRLDVAKRNLTGAITAVKRWNMMLQASQQLKQLLPTRQYRQIANSLSAVNHLSVPLKALSGNPAVAQVFRDVQDAQTQVKEKVSREMDSFFIPDPNHPPDLPAVKEACFAVDVLGDDYRNHIIERYIASELKEYRRIFSAGEAAQIDNFARRYAWFRRLLKTYDEEHVAIFPPSWNLGKCLVSKFAESTRLDMSTALEKEKPPVNVLLEAWQATSEWESQMSRRFGEPMQQILKPSSGTVSSALESHFHIFTEAQDAALSGMLSAYRGSKSRPSMEGAVESAETPMTVLPSSTELFYFYAQTLEQCGRYTNGRGMKDLADVLKKWLHIFSDDVLIASMKRPENRKSLDGRPNVQEIRNACLTLNTADYCLQTSLQLEERLKETIDEAFKDQVSFEAEQEQFVGVISACLVVLQRELEGACEPAFAAILKTPWMNLENVSGRSAYVVDLVGSIKQVAELVKERIEQKKYVRSFADRAVGAIMNRFTAAVVKSRPLRKIGAEQILLDVQAVKACFLDLLDGGSDKSHATYTKLVLKLTGQLETLLKVVLAPDDPPEGFVQNYCLLIGDKSFSNFQKVLDLKGTPRGNQQKLLDIFLSVTATQDLQDTSFLTNLEMEPDHKAVTAERSLLAPGLGLKSGTSTPQRTETPKPFTDFKRLVSFAMRGEL